MKIKLKNIQSFTMVVKPKRVEKEVSRMEKKGFSLNWSVETGKKIALTFIPTDISEVMVLVPPPNVQWEGCEGRNLPPGE